MVIFPSKMWQELRQKAEALNEARPCDTDAAPGMPGNDAAALLRETRSLLKLLALYVTEQAK